MVQTRLHKHSLSKKEQAVSSVASRASVRDPIDEFQDVYGSRAASAAFRQQLGSDFSRSSQFQPPIQAKPSFRGLSQELAAESQPVQLREAENKTGLPDDLKAGVESLSGFSMDDVRVHYNSSKPDELQALAYTQGTEIHVGPGQEKHLTHEAWHVVQQMQGRVKPTMQLKEKVNVNDDASLEREADVMGTKAIHFSEKGSTAIAQREHRKMPNTHNIKLNQMVCLKVQQKPSLMGATTQFQRDDALVIQCNGAIAELKEHLKKIPIYMHEAIYRWVGLIGASAVLAYLTGGGSLLTQATVFLLPTTGWLASGVIKLIYDRISYGEGFKIGTGPLIEDTFHLSTYSFPWSAGSYGTITESSKMPESGDYIFIFDTKDRFYYVNSSDRKVQGASLYIRHSQLAGGGKVKTAGRMKITEGTITITNESGHYWPDAKSLDSAKNFLELCKFSNVETKDFIEKKDQ
jgi:hypothetical protein